MYQMEQLARAFPGKVLLNGYDEMLLAGLSMGANGGIGSTYNVLGAAYLELVRLQGAGQPAAALAVQSKCNAVIDELVQARRGVRRGRSSVRSMIDEGRR